MFRYVRPASAFASSERHHLEAYAGTWPRCINKIRKDRSLEFILELLNGPFRSGIYEELLVIVEFSIVAIGEQHMGLQTWFAVDV